MKRRATRYHLDALDTLSKATSWMSASDVDEDTGRQSLPCTRRVLSKLEKDRAVDIQRGRPYLYTITVRGRRLLEDMTAPGDFPRVL